MRLGEGAGRVARGFFCRQKIARKCACGKQKFHSGCQNETRNFVAVQSSNAIQPRAIAAVALAQALHCVQKVREKEWRRA
jgi:hypothetical protein